MKPGFGRYWLNIFSRRTLYRTVPYLKKENEKIDEKTTFLSDEGSSSKITVVGAGKVGMAIAFSIITQNITDEVAVVDVAADKLKGELLDLQHGSAFVPGVKIIGDADYSVTKNSKICVISAGARQTGTQSRLDLLDRNVELLKNIIPQLLLHSPNTILFIVTNPVDVLTYAAWKISGRPINTIIGSGTNLDTARLKYLISSRIGINIQSVHIWIIGEHGDASVPVLSNLQVGGVNLKDVVVASEKVEGYEYLLDLHTIVINSFHLVQSAYEIIKLKGYTSWAIGLSVAQVCKSIIRNTREIHAVSTLVKGFHGIKDDVFLSLPGVLGSSGISHVIPLVLDEKEKQQFLAAALKIYKVQQMLKF